MDLSIVIPVYNEGSNCKEVLLDLAKTLTTSSLKINAEIIVVDDGSVDDSFDQATECLQAIPQLKILRHNENLGLGASLKSGIEASKGKYWTFLPSDGEVPSDEIFKLYKLRKPGNLVLGYRNDSAAEYNDVRTWRRELLSWGNSTFLKIMIGAPLNGNEAIYIVETKFLKNLKLRSKTGLLNLEVLYWSSKMRAPIIRHPISIKRRISGQSKVANFKGISKQILETVALSIKLRSEWLWER